MNAFWVKFKGFPSCCVEADTSEAAQQLGRKMTGCEALLAERIPYPALPRLTMHEYPKYGVQPAFCFKPEQCKNNTACPQNYSCTE